MASNGLRFNRGQAVYFHHLHKNVQAIPLDGKDPDSSKSYKVKVQGKPRRMLVIGHVHIVDSRTVKPINNRHFANCNSYYTADARLGYLVVSLQGTKPPDRIQSNCLGDCLNEGKNTYACFPPEAYAPELECDDRKKVAQVDKRVLGMILNLIEIKRRNFDFG